MSEASNDVNISHHAELLAKEKNFDFSSVPGTGRKGMITKADIELAIQNAPPVPTPEPRLPIYHDAEKVIDTSPNTPDVIDPELVKIEKLKVKEAYARAGEDFSATLAPLNSSDKAVEAINAEPVGGYTNIMDAQKAARRRAEGSAPAGPSDEKVIQTASNEDLLSLIAAMRGELSELKEATAGLVARDTYATDLTDDMFFIAKPGGQKWEERRIRDKRTVLVEFVGTAFFGPFKDNEMIETYLKEKSRKREDSYLEWENISVMTGKAARILDRQEKADREAEYASDVSTNVLDRRIWDQTSIRDPDAHTAQVIGPAA